MNNILTIAVHPDDETLGCRGTLLRHKANGDNIHWLIVTAMKTSSGYDRMMISARAQEIDEVSRAYGFDGIHKLDFATKHLDQMPLDNLIGAIGRVIQAVRPHTIYLPFSADVHSDHQITFKAAYSCTKTFRCPFLKRILMMETISETELAPPFGGRVFVPNVFVDISEHFPMKIKIMQIYQSELKRHPFPRSLENIESLAKLRGAAAGCNYAEAFMLLKEIG